MLLVRHICIFKLQSPATPANEYDLHESFAFPWIRRRLPKNRRERQRHFQQH